MDAVRPSVVLALAGLLVATAIATMRPPRVAPEDPPADPHALRRAQNALKMSQVEALEAHAVLLEQRLDGALTRLEIDALTAEPMFEPKLGFECAGLSCFD